MPNEQNQGQHHQEKPPDEQGLLQKAAERLSERKLSQQELLPPPTNAMQSNTGQNQEAAQAAVQQDDDSNDKRPRIFLAKGKAPKAVNDIVNIGMDASIKLPSEEKQRAGFRVDDWEILVAQFPDIYKVEKKLRKGEEA